MKGEITFSRISPTRHRMTKAAPKGGPDGEKSDCARTQLAAGAAGAEGAANAGAPGCGVPAEPPALWK